MRRLLLCLFLTLGVSTAAQELPDAGLPDASVGQGGPDMTNEENDQGAPCLDSKSCDLGAQCVSGHCVPVKPKNAGCAAVPVGAFAVVGVLGALRRRRRA